MFLFPPQERKLLHQAILDEILEVPVVSSRGRSNPRAVKRKMSKYPTKHRAAACPRGKRVISVRIVAK